MWILHHMQFTVKSEPLGKKFCLKKSGISPHSIPNIEIIPCPLSVLDQGDRTIYTNTRSTAQAAAYY